MDYHSDLMRLLDRFLSEPYDVLTFHATNSSSRTVYDADLRITISKERLGSFLALVTADQISRMLLGVFALGSFSLSVERLYEKQQEKQEKPEVFHIYGAIVSLVQEPTSTEP